jgi:hypothetical protein
MQLTWDELDIRGLSGKLWSKFAPPDGGTFHSTASGNPAIGFFDDFVGFGGILASTDGAYFSEGQRYLSQQTASTTIIPVAATPTPASVAPTSYGAIILTPTTTDGDTVGLAWGCSLVSPYHAAPFSVIPSMSKDLVFEARFKVSGTTAARGNFFIGLAGAAATLPVAADVPITSSDAFVTTLSLLGYGRLTAGTTNLDLFYERASGTVGTIASVATMVADTYIKVGFRWEAANNILRTFINGSEVTAGRCSSSVTGATPWPDDYMVPIMVVEEIGTAALTLTADWWACAQAV